MDASKLCFGDVVSYGEHFFLFRGLKPTPKDGKPCLNGWGDNFNACYDGPYGLMASVEDESIKPVAITPERLLRCGWIEEDGYWWYKGASVALKSQHFGFWEVTLDASRTLYVEATSVKWVNDLQAILRVADSIIGYKWCKDMEACESFQKLVNNQTI